MGDYVDRWMDGKEGGLIGGQMGGQVGGWWVDR